MDKKKEEADEEMPQRKTYGTRAKTGHFNDDLLPFFNSSTQEEKGEKETLQEPSDDMGDKKQQTQSETFSQTSLSLSHSKSLTPNINNSVFAKRLMAKRAELEKDE